MISWSAMFVFFLSFLLHLWCVLNETPSMKRKFCNGCHVERDVKYFSIKRRGRPDPYQSKCADCVAKYYSTHRGNMERIFNSARKRARRRKGLRRVCTITMDWVHAQWKKQRGLCSISNIPMNHTTGHPYQVSLERIDNRYGYTEANTTMICMIFQSGHTQWTPEKFNHMVSLTHDAPLSNEELEAEISNDVRKRRRSMPVE